MALHTHTHGNKIKGVKQTCRDAVDVTLTADNNGWKVKCCTAGKRYKAAHPSVDEKRKKKYCVTLQLRLEHKKSNNGHVAYELEAQRDREGLVAQRKFKA